MRQRDSYAENPRRNQETNEGGIGFSSSQSEGLWHLELGVLTVFPTFVPQDEPPPDTQHLFHPEGLCKAALRQHLEDHSCSLAAGMRREERKMMGWKSPLDFSAFSYPSLQFYITPPHTFSCSRYWKETRKRRFLSSWSFVTGGKDRY